MFTIFLLFTDTSFLFRLFFDSYVSIYVTIYFFYVTLLL